MARYVIEGGQVGYDRLRLLARTRRDDTAALFDRVEVRAGSRCLDLGCGSGDVAFELARRVGPTGHVDGIDADDIQLELVRAAARRANISNLTLRSQNILSWTSEPVYDLVYARFVLQHLSDPLTTLSRMWAALRRGGALVVEDADFSGLFAYPPDEGYDFYAQHYRQALTAHGGDPLVGQRLFGYFRQTGATGIHLTLRQQVHVGTDEGKRLSTLTLSTTAQAIIDAGLASADAVARAVLLLDRYAADPDSMLSGPRIFQVWARRA